MDERVKTKLSYALAVLAAGVFAATMGFLPFVTYSQVGRKLETSLTIPIVVPSDSIRTGMARSVVAHRLGKPQKVSGDGNTYYYFRKLKDYDRDQILVVRFRDDKVTLIDSNVNLGADVIPTTTLK